MNIKELRARCRELDIKGYSRWTKTELESAIYIKEVSNWYTDICKNVIVIDDENLEVQELNIENI
jgi:hypothetical protein